MTMNSVVNQPIFDTNLLTSKGLPTIDSIFNVLTIPSEYRSENGIIQIVSVIKNFTQFITSLNVHDAHSLHKILKEFARILHIKSFQKNIFAYRVGEKLNDFIIIYDGSISELSIKYERKNASRKDYYIHLLKLLLLKEKKLFHETLKLNKDKIKLSEDPSKWEVEDEYSLFNLYAIAQNSIINSNYISSKTAIDYIKITTTNIPQKTLEKDTHFPLIFPEFYLKQTLSKGDVIGTYGNSKHVSLKSTYITNEKTKIFYIPKNTQEYSNSKLYSLLLGNNRNNIEEVYNGFFIFHDISKNKFLDNFTDYFIYQKVKKGDTLISQNCHSEGVYFVMKGNFLISTNRTFTELNQLIANLKESLDNFNSNSVNFLNKNVHKEFPSTNFVSNPVYMTDYFATLSKERKKISLLNFNSKQIIGLNEFYHFKTEINHFNLQCLSEEGEVYFIPKENFYSMINKVNTFLEKAKKLIEQKVMFYSITLKRYKEKFVSDIEKSKNVRVLLLNRKKSEKSNFIDKRMLQRTNNFLMRKSSSLINIRALRIKYTKEMDKKMFNHSCSEKKLQFNKNSNLSTLASFFGDKLNKTQQLFTNDKLQRSTSVKNGNLIISRNFK